jgi:hypothetical protein
MDADEVTGTGPGIRSIENGHFASSAAGLDLVSPL